MNYIRLKEICDLQNGYAFKSDDYVENSNTLVCRMSNIRPNSSFDILYNPKYLPDNYSIKYKDYLLFDGDLVIAMTDMANDPKILGIPTIVETKGFSLLLNQRVGKLTKIDKNNVYIPYLKLALSRADNKAYFKKFAGGGLQLNIGKQEILNIKIPLPPFSTQIHIANILTKAENLIAQRKESIRLLDEYLKSIFIERFVDKNYPLDKLENLCSKITDGEHLKPNYIESGFPFISVVNISQGFLNFENCKYVSENDFIKFTKRCKPELNDIIYTKVGATYGRAVLVNTERPFCLYVSVALIKPIKEKVNSKFLHFAINHPFVKRQADKSIKGAGVPDLHLIEIKSFKIPIPPRIIQDEFAQIVEKTELLKVQYQQSLQELENLYGSLSQRAFRGQLTPKEYKLPNDYAQNSGLGMAAEP